MKNMTIYGAFRSAAINAPKKIALHFLGSDITFSNALSEADKVAGGLHSIGIKTGESVTICLPNIPQAVFAFYGVNKLGAVANMLHPLLPAQAIIEGMKFTDSTTIFMLDQVYAKHKDAFDKENFNIILCSIGEYLPFIKSVFYSLKTRKVVKKLGRLTFPYLLADKELEADTDLHAPRVYLHSGGTTGSPKTIMLSNFNINALSAEALDIIDAKSGDSYGMLASLPLFHGFGLCMGIHAPLANEFTSQLIPTFDMKMIVSAINKSNVTFITGVPTMFDKLLSFSPFVENKKLKNLRIAFCGGDTMPTELKRRFDALMDKVGADCKMFEGYGLTETVTVCAVNTKKSNKPGSIGKALSCAKIKIVDKMGNALPPNELGEIAISGDTVMLGYLKNEESSKAVINNGYVLSGDYGYMDEDEFVYFKQRLKRIIKVSGVAVFPSEIEDFAATLPEVKLSCALPVPDDRCGALVKLFVVPKDGISRSDETKNRIRAALREKLMKWAVPKEIEFMDSLPLTLVGKVDFKKLQEIVDEKKNIT